MLNKEFRTRKPLLSLLALSLAASAQIARAKETGAKITIHRVTPAEIYQNSKEGMDEQIKKNPTSINYTQRAVYFSRRGKVTEALMDYASAIKTDPKNIHAYYSRAKLYKKMNAKSQSEADLAMVKKLDPGFIAKQEKMQAQLEDWVNGLRKKQSELFPSQELSMEASIEGGKKNYDQVIKLTTKALATFPMERKNYKQASSANLSESYIYSQRAYAYITKRDYAKALTDLNKCLELSPNNFDARMNRARIYGIQGNTDLAKKEIELARLQRDEGRKQVMTRAAEENFDFDPNAKTKVKTK